MDHRTFHFLLLFSTVLSSLSLLSFAVLTSRPRSRKQGILGLLGSAFLLCGLLCGQLSQNAIAGITLETSGVCLLFLSSLAAIKRRYS